MLPLELSPNELGRLGIPWGELSSTRMPCAASSSFSLRFSSAYASRSLAVLEKTSLRRKTSCSRALIYISFRSRWVLVPLSESYHPSVASVSYLCACLLSSCRLVSAGLLSGFGPRLFGGCPSDRVFSSVAIAQFVAKVTSCCLLSAG